MAKTRYSFGNSSEFHYRGNWAPKLIRPCRAVTDSKVEEPKYDSNGKSLQKIKMPKNMILGDKIRALRSAFTIDDWNAETPQKKNESATLNNVPKKSRKGNNLMANKKHVNKKIQKQSQNEKDIFVLQREKDTKLFEKIELSSKQRVQRELSELFSHHVRRLSVQSMNKCKRMLSADVKDIIDDMMEADVVHTAPTGVEDAEEDPEDPATNSSKVENTAGNSSREAKFVDVSTNGIKTGEEAKGTVPLHQLHNLYDIDLSAFTITDDNEGTDSSPMSFSEKVINNEEDCLFSKNQSPKTPEASGITKSNNQSLEDLIDDDKCFNSSAGDAKNFFINYLEETSDETLRSAILQQRIPKSVGVMNCVLIVDKINGVYKFGVCLNEDDENMRVKVDVMKAVDRHTETMRIAVQKRQLHRNRPSIKPTQQRVAETTNFLYQIVKKDLTRALTGVHVNLMTSCGKDSLVLGKVRSDVKRKKFVFYSAGLAPRNLEQPKKSHKRKLMYDHVFVDDHGYDGASKTNKQTLLSGEPYIFHNSPRMQRERRNSFARCELGALIFPPSDQHKRKLFRSRDIFRSIQRTKLLFPLKRIQPISNSDSIIECFKNSHMQDMVKTMDTFSSSKYCDNESEIPRISTNIELSSTKDGFGVTSIPGSDIRTPMFYMCETSKPYQKHVRSYHVSVQYPLSMQQAFSMALSYLYAKKNGEKHSVLP